jgi:hypothetical protein
MSSFIRFIFMLVVAAAIIGLSVVVMGNYSGKLKQDRKLEAERQRIADRYTVSAEDRTLPAAHIAVESQEISGSTVLRTTILIKQYRFNDMKPVDALQTQSAILKDDSELREALPLKRLVVQGRTLQLSGLYVHFKPAIPNYEFLADKSVWCLADVYLNADGKTVEKFFIPSRVPDAMLEEGRPPSLMESNLWYFVGAALDGAQKGETAAIERLSKFDVRLHKSRQITLNQRAAYRVDIKADDITIVPEQQASLHLRILTEAEEQDKRQ